MFMHSNFMILLLAFTSGALLWGCAAPPQAQAPRFPWGQPVEFEGISFDFNSARTASSFTWVKKEVAGADTFVIVEVTMKNNTGSPLPAHFQPVFRLLDPTGAVYEPHLQYTMNINWQKPGRISPFRNMNPNTNLKQELVFEVPWKKYDLQVIVPSRARVGFAGSVTASGPYFLVDMSSQLTQAPAKDTVAPAVPEVIREKLVPSIQLPEPFERGGIRIIIEGTHKQELGSLVYWHVSGLATNTTDKGVRALGIALDVVDSSGAKVAEARAFTSGLQPGQTWKFQATATISISAEVTAIRPGRIVGKFDP